MDCLDNGSGITLKVVEWWSAVSGVVFVDGEKAGKQGVVGRGGVR